VIYLDSSVALAHLLAEDRTPPPALWQEPLIASRLLEYEIWNRLNARGLNRSHGEHARRLVGRVAIIELAPPVLERALELSRRRCAHSMRYISLRLSSCAVGGNRWNSPATTIALSRPRWRSAFRSLTFERLLA